MLLLLIELWYVVCMCILGQINKRSFQFSLIFSKCQKKESKIKVTLINTCNLTGSTLRFLHNMSVVPSSWHAPLLPCSFHTVIQPIGQGVDMSHDSIWKHEVMRARGRLWDPTWAVHGCFLAVFAESSLPPFGGESQWVRGRGGGGERGRESKRERERESKPGRDDSLT